MKRGARGWGLAWRAFGLAVLSLAMASPSFATRTAGGSIAYPCASPTSTSRNITPDGFCGRKITIPIHGLNYTLASSPAADMDISFYAADGSFITTNAGPPLSSNQCVTLSGARPALAVTAIITTTPSYCGTGAGVTVTYTSTP